MRFIVSPAKKMNVVDDAFAWHGLPRFIDDAEQLLEVLRALSYGEAKALWGCSDTLAELNFERVRTMDLRAEGALTPAVVAYEGIQYQHLAPRVMDEAQLAYVQEHLRILSGFYGVLHPLEGVVPYRLEMQAKLAAGGAPDLYAFWGDRLYRTLADEADVIVNLASVEYAKAHRDLSVRHRRHARPPQAACHRRQGRSRLDGALVRRAQRPMPRGPARLRSARPRLRRGPLHRRLFRVRARLSSRGSSLASLGCSQRTSFRWEVSPRDSI